MIGTETARAPANEEGPTDSEKAALKGCNARPSEVSSWIITAFGYKPLKTFQMIADDPAQMWTELNHGMRSKNKWRVEYVN